MPLTPENKNKIQKIGSEFNAIKITILPNSLKFEGFNDNNLEEPTIFTRDKSDLFNRKDLKEFLEEVGKIKKITTIEFPNGVLDKDQLTLILNWLIENPHISKVNFPIVVGLNPVNTSSCQDLQSKITELAKDNKRIFTNPKQLE